MSPDTAKSIYRTAIDPKAFANHDDAWWAAVVSEVVAVCAAPDTEVAASFIAWWHDDWRCVNDSPRRAAHRIRRAAKRLGVTSAVPAGS